MTVIISYQGPSFTQIRAVKLAEGLSATEYAARLPEAACVVHVNVEEDLVGLPWGILSKIYRALAGEPGGDKMKDLAVARTAVFNLVQRVAENLTELPPSRAGRVAKDDEETPRARIVDESSSVKAVKEKKPKPPKLEDKWSTMTVDQLSAAAKKKGYKEEPAPNGGVRVMRLRNWLRKNG